MVQPPAEDLPPFSGDETVCAKCRYIGASTTYLAYGRCTHGQLNETIGYEPNERLHRDCRRCGFTWDEALPVPDDAVPDRGHVIKIKVRDLKDHLDGRHSTACLEIHHAEEGIKK